MNSGDPPPNQQPPPSRPQYRPGDSNNAGDPDPLTPKNHAKVDTQTTNKKKRQTPGGNSPENWKRIKPNEDPSDNALAEGIASMQRMASSQETPMNNDGSDPNVDGISESDNSTIDSASQYILDDNKKPSARKDTASVHDASPSKENTPANNGETGTSSKCTKNVDPSKVAAKSTKENESSNVDSTQVPAKSGDVTRKMNNQDTFETQLPSTSSGATNRTVHTGHSTVGQVGPTDTVTSASGATNPPVDNSGGSGSDTHLSLLLRIVCEDDTNIPKENLIWTLIHLIRMNKLTDLQIEAIAPPDVMMQVGRLVDGEHVTLAEAVLQFFSVIALRGKKELVQSVMNTLRETKDTHHILLKAITSNPPGDAAFYFISLLEQMAIHLKAQTPLLSNEKMKEKVCDVLFPFLELGDSRSVHYATARCFHTLCNVMKSMAKLLMEKDVLSKLVRYVTDKELEANHLGLQLLGVLCESGAIDEAVKDPSFQELWVPLLFQATKTPVDPQTPFCTEIVIDAISSLTHLFGTPGVPKNISRHRDDVVHITSLSLYDAYYNVGHSMFARLHVAAGKFVAIYFNHFSNVAPVHSWTPFPFAQME